MTLAASLSPASLPATSLRATPHPATYPPTPPPAPAPPPILAIACLAAGVLAGLLAARAQSAPAPALRRTRIAAGVLKMAAATAYVGFGLALGATETAYGRLLLLGLGLSWLGDLSLLGRSGRLFLAGLASFLLAHVAYALAFATTLSAAGAAAGPARVVVVAAVAAAAMATVGVLVFRWLERGSLPARMRWPVALYLLAIGAMVALAAAATPVHGTVLLAGAVAFAASDVLVARQRFVHPGPANRLVGLPLYFGAQLLLASTVAQPMLA